MTQKQISAQLDRQREKDKIARRVKAAGSAVAKFRPKKDDRGKLVFVNTKGQRAQPGRRGFLVKITRTGKKRLVFERKKGLKSLRSFMQPKTRVGWTGRRLYANKKALPPVRVLKAGAVKLSHKIGSPTFNPSGNTFKALASDIRKVLLSVAGRRVFTVRVLAVVEIPGGGTKTIEIFVPIAKRSFSSVSLAREILPFVRQVLYGALARELARFGYVLKSSLNHIRGLKENQGRPKDEWVNKKGEKWQGADLQPVTIKRLEWRIEK